MRTLVEQLGQQTHVALQQQLRLEVDASQSVGRGLHRRAVAFGRFSTSVDQKPHAILTNTHASWVEKRFSNITPEPVQRLPRNALLELLRRRHAVVTHQRLVDRSHVLKQFAVRSPSCRLGARQLANNTRRQICTCNLLIDDDVVEQMSLEKRRRQRKRSKRLVTKTRHESAQRRQSERLVRFDSANHPLVLDRRRVLEHRVNLALQEAKQLHHHTQLGQLVDLEATTIRHVVSDAKPQTTPIRPC
jgi:hypothetical protein